MNILLLGLLDLMEGFQELGHHVLTCATRFIHSYSMMRQSATVTEKFRHVICQIHHEFGM
ncbi:hypothetical protein [Candidatus Nitrospira salsa]